jgi:conjugal transfer mating pair stabilization protein TraG
MNFMVITYGAAEVLDTTFNALAALLNSRTGTLYQPLVRLSLIVGLVWATVSMISGDHMRFIKTWALPAILMLVLFFAPTCRVHIYDPVSGHRYTVDHVPWGLGAVAGVISKIGHAATQEIEKTFSLPDDLKYHKTGAVMASHLIANANTFHITNTDLAETLQSFMTQCVVYDALLGKKYTLHDLKNSPDIWNLVTSNLSPARSFTFKAPGRNQVSQIMPCNRAVELLDLWLKRDIQNAFQLFESKVFGAKASIPHLASVVPGAQLKQYLPGAFDYMTQMSKSAEDYMMQQMMIYSVVESIENTSTGLGNAPNFAVRRAYLQQRATQETLTGVAAQKLIAMKNVLEALIYAAFLFILPLALLPRGWSYIMRWISLVLWIQLWPPLYAILNFIMNVSVRAKGMGMIAGPEGSGITIASSVGFMNLHADMAAQAGFLSIAVGTLAYAIVKGGVAGFGSLVSHITAPAMSSASRAAEDLISGNYSFGNVNQGNMQAYNTSFGQQNYSPSYSSGAFTQNDGVISRTTGAEGGHMVNVSNSNLRSSLNFSESLSNSYTEQANKAKQLSESQMMASATAEADHNRSVMDLSQHQAKQTSSSDSHSTGKTATSNQAFSKLDGLVERFAKDHSLSKESAAQILGRASVAATTGVGFQFLGNGATLTGSLEASGQISGSKSDRNIFSAAKDYAKQSNFQEALNAASQVARDGRYSEMSDEGKRYVKGISDSYEKSHQYRNEASANLQKSQGFSQMAATTKQNAGSINASLNQEYVNWLQGQSLPNSQGPMGIQEAETILSSRPEIDAQYQQRFMEGKMQQAEQFMGTHGLPSNSADIEKAYEQVHITNPVNQGNGYVASQAAASGFGDDFKVNTKPRDEARNVLSSTDQEMMEHQQNITKQADQRKAEVGIEAPKSPKAIGPAPQHTNIGEVYSRATEPGALSRLAAGLGGSQNMLDQAESFQAGSVQSESGQSPTPHPGAIQNEPKFIESHGRLSKHSDSDRVYEQASQNITNPVGQERGKIVPPQTVASDFGNDFKVNTSPQDEAQHVLSSTDQKMVQHQQEIGKQTDQRKGEVAIEAPMLPKTIGPAPQPTNMGDTRVGDIYAQAAEPGGLSRLATGSGGSQNILGQRESLQTGSVQTAQPKTVESQTQSSQAAISVNRGEIQVDSQGSFQNRGDSLKIPSNKDLKDKLNSIEDKLMAQQEFFEKEAQQRQEGPLKS